MKNQKLNITTLIGKGSVMDGDFASPGSVRIDGKIGGNVNVEGTLVVGTSGMIRGNVKCSGIIVGGEIEGNIIAPERAELSSTSRVIGDIHTGNIIIDEKALFHGKCIMEDGLNTARDKDSFSFKAKERKDSKSAVSEVKEALEEASENEPEPVTENAADNLTRSVKDIPFEDALPKTPETEEASEAEEIPLVEKVPGTDEVSEALQ